MEILYFLFSLMLVCFYASSWLFFILIVCAMHSGSSKLIEVHHDELKSMLALEVYIQNE